MIEIKDEKRLEMFDRLLSIAQAMTQEQRLAWVRANTGTMTLQGGEHDGRETTILLNPFGQFDQCYLSATSGIAFNNEPSIHLANIQPLNSPTE